VSLSQNATPKYCLSATNTDLLGIFGFYNFVSPNKDKVEIEVKLKWVVIVTGVDYSEAHWLACQ
jgi:hypothetical protein